MKESIKMKNSLWILIFIFCTHSLFASQIGFTPKEKAWLEKHPIINVSNENDWAPFDYAENGKAKGYSVDLIKILAKNIGIKVNFIQGSWTELLMAFDEKSIDLMHVMTKDKEREKKYSFSTAYMQWRISYFIRDDDKSINSVNDLWRGKRVAQSFSLLTLMIGCFSSQAFSLGVNPIWLANRLWVQKINIKIHRLFFILMLSF